jgi:hypothetical protein
MLASSLALGAAQVVAKRRSLQIDMDSATLETSDSPPSVCHDYARHAVSSSLLYDQAENDDLNNSDFMRPEVMSPLILELKARQAKRRGMLPDQEEEEEPETRGPPRRAVQVNERDAVLDGVEFEMLGLNAGWRVLM